VGSLTRGAVVGQILVVAVPMGLWLALAERFGLGIGGVLPAPVGPLVHVVLNGVFSVALILFALRREPNVRGALGLEPMRVGTAIGLGLAAVATAYVVQSFAAGIYLVVSRANLDAELASKQRWTAALADIPLAAVLPLAVFVGVYEEVLFRGFLLGRLRLCFRTPTPPVLISAVLFAAGHAYQGTLGLVQTSVVGVVLGALAVARSSIWPCIVAHVTIDTFGLVALRVLRPALERMLHAPS
jgi:membrane protease YdiL (CAAX protease family)